MQPIASSVSFKTIAHVVSLWKNVRIISRLSSTDLCAGHPARGPTSGSEAYLKSASASDSAQWRSEILSVSISLFQSLAFGECLANLITQLDIAMMNRVENYQLHFLKVRISIFCQIFLIHKDIDDFCAKNIPR